MLKDDIFLGIVINTFDNTGETPFVSYKINEIDLDNIMNNISMWIQPRGGTDFCKALELSNNTLFKYNKWRKDNKIEHYEVFRICISDGYHNSGELNIEQLKNTYKNSIDISIGLGKVGEFDMDLMSTISKEPEAFTAPDESSAREKISSDIFGFSTVVAKKLKLSIKKEYVLELVTPYPIQKNDTHYIILFKDFHLHRNICMSLTLKAGVQILPITINYMKDTLEYTSDIKIHLTDKKNKNRFKYNFIKSLCDISNSLINVQDIKDQPKRITFLKNLVQKINIDNLTKIKNNNKLYGVSNLIETYFTILKQINKIISYDKKGDHLTSNALYRGTVRQTSTGIYNAIGNLASLNYKKSL